MTNFGNRGNDDPGFGPWPEQNNSDPESQGAFANPYGTNLDAQWNTTSEAKHKKRPKTALIAGGAVAALALLAGGYFLGTPSSTEANELAYTTELDAPPSDNDSSNSSATSTTTSTSASAVADLDYALINDEGQLDCSKLSEIPEFASLNPKPNESADDGFITTQPMESQWGPFTQCMFNTDEVNTIMISTLPDGCPQEMLEGAQPYNSQKDWNNWVWRSSEMQVQAEDLDPAVAETFSGDTAINIQYRPSSTDASIGCINIGAVERFGNTLNAIHDNLDALAEIIYENSPQL